MSLIRIGGKEVGQGKSCFVIAEAGANFRVSEKAEENLEQALKLIDIAAEAKADAVKFQLYKAEKMYAENAGEADYIKKKKPISDIIREMELPYEWLPKLKQHCDEKGIQFLCTPFDEGAADTLEKAGVQAFKLASYAIDHVPLLKHVARKGKPMILSTGASAHKDIEAAIEAIKKEGNSQIVLMQCTAKYPAPLSTVNLRTIPGLMQRYNVPVGLSDHSREPFIAPLGAVALGASIVEKHFTTDNSLPGPDHGFAVLPEELKLMVSSIREIEQAMGSQDKHVLEEEKELFEFCRRSIYASKAIGKGQALSRENIAVLRPGKREKGLGPEQFEKALGSRAKRAIAKGEPVKQEDLEAL